MGGEDVGGWGMRYRLTLKLTTRAMGDAFGPPLLIYYGNIYIRHAIDGPWFFPPKYEIWR